MCACVCVLHGRTELIDQKVRAERASLTAEHDGRREQDVEGGV